MSAWAEVTKATWDEPADVDISDHSVWVKVQKVCAGSISHEWCEASEELRDSLLEAFQDEIQEALLEEALSGSDTREEEYDGRDE